MTSKFSKIIAATAIAGVLVGATQLATSTSAAANDWGDRGYHHGGEWAGAAAVGLLGALAIGAAVNAAQQPGYDAYPAYRPCYLSHQPVTDDWGQILYFERVRVCN